MNPTSTLDRLAALDLSLCLRLRALSSARSQALFVAVSRAGDGWLWLALAALVSTVGAVVLFFSGMSRVGPSTAAILSTVEPPVTVALVFLTFGQALGVVQLLGALAVLSAAVIVNLPVTRVASAAPH